MGLTEICTYLYTQRYCVSTKACVHQYMCIYTYIGWYINKFLNVCVSILLARVM